MSYPGCRRKHTPIVSRAQQRLFAIWKRNPKRRPKSITRKEVEMHLAESRGKRLPARRSRTRRRRSR